MVDWLQEGVGTKKEEEEEEGGEQQKTTQQQLVLVSASVGRRPQQWGTLVPPACGKHFVCCFVYDDSLKYFPAAVVTPYCSCQQFFEGLLGHSSLLLPRIAIWQACSSASPQWQITFLESLPKFLQIDSQSEFRKSRLKGLRLSTTSWEFLESWGSFDSFLRSSVKSSWHFTLQVHTFACCTFMWNILRICSRHLWVLKTSWFFSSGPMLHWTQISPRDHLAITIR